MDSRDRDDFIAGLRPGKKYAGITGLVRHWNGLDYIGPLDYEIIEALPPSVKFIASLGAGYDMIDIDACKQRGLFCTPA